MEKIKRKNIIGSNLKYKKKKISEKIFDFDFSDNEADFSEIISCITK